MRAAIVALAIGATAIPVAAQTESDDKADKEEDPNANCVCPPQDLKSRSISKHIFVGKAVERNDNPKHEGEAMPAKYEYRFEIDEWLKGELPDPIMVRTFSVTCTTDFDLGQTYLIFANRNEYGQILASYCSGNRIAEPKVIAEVKKILKIDNGGSSKSGKTDGGAKAPKTNTNTKTGDGDGSKGGVTKKVIIIVVAAIAALLVGIVFVRRRA